MTCGQYTPPPKPGQIAPGAFAPNWRSDGATSRYSTYYGSFLTVRGCLDALMVGKNHLARLLGLTAPRQVFRWLAQDSRPSPVYLQRLVHLLLMDKAGIPLVMLWAINWETGELVWRKGFEPEGVGSPEALGPGRSKTYLDGQEGGGQQLPKSFKYAHEVVKNG